MSLVLSTETFLRRPSSSIHANVDFVLEQLHISLTSWAIIDSGKRCTIL